MKILAVADHTGPYATLRALEPSCPGTMSFALGRAASAMRSKEGLPTIRVGLDSAASDYDALFRGTSEAEGPESLENSLARVFTQAGRPVFAIEDFPLNYRSGKIPPVDALFVEFDEARERHASRGVPIDRVMTSGSPRYTGVAEAKSAPLRGGTVLWAGQPDQEASFRTLEILIPVLRAADCRLLFRAHPRDEFYRDGHYRPLLEQGGKDFVDVTEGRSLDDLLDQADLVLTQYSTVALEAQTRGVPALFVLLPGVNSMNRFKGHEWLPWCDRNAVFSVRKTSDLEAVFRRALYDKLARSETLGRFGQIAAFNAGAAGRIWTHIRGALAGRSANPASSY